MLRVTARVMHITNFEQRFFAKECALTHWGRDKMAAIFLTTFWNVFSWMKMYEFRLRFHWNVFIGSDNGLAPTRRQAIIWANDG